MTVSIYSIHFRPLYTGTDLCLPAFSTQSDNRPCGTIKKPSTNAGHFLEHIRNSAIQRIIFNNPKMLRLRHACKLGKFKEEICSLLTARHLTVGKKCRDGNIL